uniref:Uncharacterized protein n=1 Tax=Salarias fasciatus TaxID=181472 RepID=A0A672HY26_SALFA
MQFIGSAIWVAGGNKLADMSMKGCGPREQCFQELLENKHSRSDPNGKKCFTCDGQQCTGTLKCLGNEDHCISATGGRKISLKGCASQEICSAINFPGAAELAGYDMKCCEGDFYNSGSSTSAGLLVLLVPLISLVLFS